jgi:hypothetical protein
MLLDVLKRACPCEPLVRVFEQNQGTLGCPRESPFAFVMEENGWVQQHVTHEGVHAHLVHDGSAIRAEIVSATSSAQASRVRGKVTVKVEPFPTVLSTMMLPP